MTRKTKIDLNLPSPFGAESLTEGYQKRYLPYFSNAPGVVLDIGCGHGGVLSFLKNAGIPSYGVDSSETALRLCEEKGLDVRLGDAIGHLKALPSASLGGIFCAHVIEHMDPARAIELLKESCRVLKPDSRLIIITPNSKDLRTTERFWLDVTHVRPYPEKLLVPLLEREGFAILEVAEDREPTKNIFERVAKILLRIWFMGYMFRGDLVVIAEARPAARE